MPCWTQQQVDVKVEVAFTVDNEKILVNGLLAAGWDVTQRMITRTEYNIVATKGARVVEVDLNRQRLIVSENNQAAVNEIKRAYSFEVVKQSASRFGWNLTATKDADTLLARRRF